MNRIVGILALVLLLTAGGILALLNHERNAATSRLDAVEAERKKLEGELAAARAERDSLRRQLQRQTVAASEAPPAAGAGKPAATAPGAPATPAGEKAGETAAAKPKVKNPMAEMFKNPAMKDMMKQQQIAALDLQYGKLFAQFRLGEEDKAEFKRLLADRIQREAELGIRMLDDVSPEQRRALTQEYEDAKKASDARIREFLNSDADYITFKRWEDTKAERMQLDMGRGLFANAGEPLTPQQEEQLIGAMQTVRQQPSDVPDLSKPQNFDPARLTQAEIDKQLAHFDASAQAVAAQAAQFLSPKQVEALRTMQQQWRSMSEAGLKMTSMMFQSQAQPPSK